MKPFINKLLFFCLICILWVGVFAPNIVAKQSIQISDTTAGFIIEYPKLDYYKQNELVKLDFHVYNKSDGLIVSNIITSCAFHLYNSSGYEIVDNHTLEKNTNKEDFIFHLNNSYTNIITDYSYIISCNNSKLGGFVSAPIAINYNGLEPPSDFVKVFFILGFIIVLALSILGLANLMQHFFTEDVDLKDLAYMYILYFVILSLKLFNTEYMGSVSINGFADLMVNWGSVAYILVPTALFIWSYVKRVLREAQ